MLDGEEVKETASFARLLDRLDGGREHAGDFDSSFPSDKPAADTHSPMASIAAAALSAAVLFASPGPAAASVNPTTPDRNMTHVPETIAAMAIVADPKATLEGVEWKPSEVANTRQFFEGHNLAAARNADKLESTTEAVESLADTHKGLTGAVAEIKEQQSLDAKGLQAQTTPTTDRSAPGVGRIAGTAALNSAAGWGATSVANFLAPGLAPAIALASTVHTMGTVALQGAGMAFAQGPSTPQYDRPRTKAEAREQRDPAAQSNYNNYFSQPQSTAGGMIASTPTSKKAFEQAGNPAATTLEKDPRNTQIALLEKAANEVRTRGVEQTGHMENAERAAEAHTEYAQSGGANFDDIKELFRAAEGGAMNNVQEMALNVAAKVANPETAEKIEQKFALRNLDLGLGFTTAPMGPSAGSGARLA
ncbi:MAG: hypothetical protein H6855_01860 [Rhodospirillales bacterium]|nr:hypothetical protein [Rhodospirillales bacterium]MCB9980483.1 hypothetical protein [Rhodospirillales bacterium]